MDLLTSRPPSTRSTDTANDAGPLTATGCDHTSVRLVGGQVVLDVGGETRLLHAQWLRERSVEPGEVDQTNRQRLYEPVDLPDDLAVLSAAVSGGCVDVAFSDGHRCRIPVDRMSVDAGLAADPEAPPAAVPWATPPNGRASVAWDDLVAPCPAAVLEALGAYFRYGFFRITGAPVEEGSLAAIAGRFGRVSATNFGVLFDVRSVPQPSDLAYTAVALSSHTDQPYRRPTPAIQFLHALVNDAPGGESTLVDGLAAIQELATADPAAFEALATVEVEFRYDVGDDVVVARAPIIELDRDGGLRQIRFSPRLDFAPAIDPARLDLFHRGRRWLAEHFARPDRQVRFRLAAGDVVVVDNHRVLHGRAAFDPRAGHRHLQGCYIDLDGPDTMWRLTVRGQRRGTDR